jgi:hypothetical protein
VVVPLLAGLPDRDRQRADVVLARWRKAPDTRLRQAAALIDQQARPEAPPQGDTHERAL